VTQFFQGKLEPALAQFRRGFEMFDPNMQFPDWPGSHPAVQCQFFPMLISWMLAYPDRSAEEAAAAVKSAEMLGHPVTLAQTLCSVALVHIFATSHRRPPTMPGGLRGSAKRSASRCIRRLPFARVDGRSTSLANARRDWPKLLKG
jgi:hypothetical protein